MPSQQIDDNFRTITSNAAFLTSSAWTFAETTTGTAEAHTLFTVDGDVYVQNLIGICSSDLTGANATIEVGISGDTIRMIPLTTATTIDSGRALMGNTGTTGNVADLYANGSTGLLGYPLSSADIIATIRTAAITGGVITWYVTWRPLSSGATITATTPA